MTSRETCPYSVRDPVGVVDVSDVVAGARAGIAPQRRCRASSPHFLLACAHVMIVDMWLLCAVFGVLGAAVLFANLVATRWVWRSDLLETSQKVAQTAFMWLVPVACLWFGASFANRSRANRGIER